MARETVSEGLVSSANVFYRKSNFADVKKNDARIRLVRYGGATHAMYSGSSGLDYSGVCGGRYVSFELKETEQDALPVSGIRMSQLDTMEREAAMGGEPFLLVLFKSLGDVKSTGDENSGEWYRLDWTELRRALSAGFGSLPVRFFRAFGYLIPSHRGFPEYLSPEAHPVKNLLARGYPDWMPTIREKTVAKLPARDNRDLDARRDRIRLATERGVRSAIRKNKEVEIARGASGIRKNHEVARGNNARAQGRDSFED